MAPHQVGGGAARRRGAADNSDAIREEREGHGVSSWGISPKKTILRDLC